MPSSAQYLDTLLFAALPYTVLVIFFLKTIERYREQAFSYSSLSSQLLENQHHFWAVVPFHFGILLVLTGHVIGFLLPRPVLWWNSSLPRLYLLETVALVCGLLTLVGLVAVVLRRAGNSRVRVVTSRADWVLYALLLVQVFTGVSVALFKPWGSSWFAAAMAPYLWSIVKLNPAIGLVSGLPWLVKLHLVNMWLVLGVFPFTRLVHILVIPNQYLWRKPQVVRWYRDRRAGRCGASKG
ncbi:MAG: respiratory nitrate reductase subunit gamma [Fimbriimonadaceae bacterium]|nr:respiratory nitrate reductase subunit gamma [Fimbriimonadaceae bacterium]